MNIKKLSYITIAILVISCGGGGSSSTSNNSNSNSNTNNNFNQEPILTEKLIGTPFEPYETGDEFEECEFIQNEFFTETVSEEDLPIPVFAAYFTESEEEAIREGIEIANTAVRPSEDEPDIGLNQDIFEFVDEWVDDARVIMKVDTIVFGGATANTVGLARTFGFINQGGVLTNDTYTTDWEIRIKSSVDLSELPYLVAHEIGHGLGIAGHRRINYDDEFTTSELEENSIMQEVNFGTETNDYNFMMRHQAENLVNNFGQTDFFRSGSCISEGDFGDTN